MNSEKGRNADFTSALDNTARDNINEGRTPANRSSRSTFIKKKTDVNKDETKMLQDKKKQFEA